MTLIYPETTVYIKDTSNLDLTPYVIGEITVEYGIQGNGVLDRVASTGTAGFILNDKDDLFKPDSVSYDARFKKGAIVFILTRYLDGASYVNKTFTGRISDISYTTYSTTYKLIKVTVLDWINIAANQPMISPAFATNKRADEAISTIISASPIAPANTSYHAGTDTFTTVFDTVRTETKALTEISKLTLSEYGYFYVKHGALTGETVVFEGRNYRNALSTSAIVIDEITDSEIKNGEKVSNRIKVRAYPRIVDTSIQILSSLDSPILLQSGETKSGLVISYKNPNQTSERVNGKNMISPVSGTDYEMWSNADGTGSNYNVNLGITVVYGTANATYTLKNNGDTSAYVTKLNARGYGIYFFNPLEYVSEDTASELVYGYKELTLDQKYQSNPYVSNDLAFVLLNQLKAPVREFNSVSGLANTSKDSMDAFLTYDIGTKINIVDDLNAVNENFFIQNVRYVINPGGLISFSWGVVPSSSTERAFWVLEVTGKTELDLTTILGY